MLVSAPLEWSKHHPWSFLHRRRRVCKAHITWQLFILSTENNRIAKLGLIQVQPMITGPPNGAVLFCTLSSVGVCNAAGGRAHGRSTLHGEPVRLRPFRAAPCCT